MIFCFNNLHQVFTTDDSYRSGGQAAFLVIYSYVKVYKGTLGTT